MRAGLRMCLHQPELPARSPVRVAVGGHLVQAHLAVRSLLSCSDEVALSHKELRFHFPCLPASAARLACAVLGLSEARGSQSWDGKAPGGKVTYAGQAVPRDPWLLGSASVVFCTSWCLGQQLLASFGKLRSDLHAGLTMTSWLLSCVCECGLWGSRGEPCSGHHTCNVEVPSS